MDSKQHAGIKPATFILPLYCNVIIVSLNKMYMYCEHFYV